MVLYLKFTCNINSLIWVIPKLYKTNLSYKVTSFLDLYMSVSDGYVGSEIYDWRDDFSFDVLRLIFKDLCFSVIIIFYLALMRK